MRSAGTRQRAAALFALLLSACGPGQSGQGAAQAQEGTQPASSAAVSCGKSGQPDCPLQGWMKSTLQSYQRAGDSARLAHSFRTLAAHAPAGYDNWQKLSERGAAAASAKDDATVRQVCKECHNTLRARYRNELRTAPIW